MVPRDLQKQASARIAEALANVIAEPAGVVANIVWVQCLLAPVGGPAHFAGRSSHEFLTNQAAVFLSNGWRFPPDEVENLMGQDAFAVALVAQQFLIQNDQPPMQKAGRMHLRAPLVEFTPARAEIAPKLHVNGLAGKLNQFQARRSGHR